MQELGVKFREWRRWVFVFVFVCGNKLN
jgi:hypothetical protein